jgi:adenylate kinase
MQKKVDSALYINVDDGVLIERLSSRLTCRARGHVFNLKFNRPQVEGICDYDGSELYQRPDDTPETAQKRLEVYFEQTRPIIGYYRDKGVLCEVNGDQYIETVTWELQNCLR